MFQNAYSSEYLKTASRKRKMDNKVYSLALKNTLNEIRNVCPDVISTFMFKEDGEIIAEDEGTPEKTIVRVVDAFDGVLEKASAIGGVEGAIIEGHNGRVSVSCLNDIYLVTVTSRKADMNYVNAVNRVLIPTVLKLLDKIRPDPLKSELLTSETESEFPTVKESEEHAKETPDETSKSESLLPEPPVKQFIVENLGGLLVPTDTVRVDNEVVLEWKELYSDRKIAEVEIETFGGKTTRCKVKPIKGSKYEGKGIIQIPERIQLTLEVKKGELVRVKPIVD